MKNWIDFLRISMMVSNQLILIKSSFFTDKFSAEAFMNEAFSEGIHELGVQCRGIHELSIKCRGIHERNIQ